MSGMHPGQHLLTTLLACALPSCFLAAAAQPQQLPLRARLCLPTRPAQPCVDLEVPETPQQYAIGLMERRSLPAHQGMWFRFSSQDVGFWMHRTRLPLDMVFLVGSETPVVTRVVAAVPPCEARPCPVISAGEPIDHMVELAAGQASRLGLEPGVAVSLTWLPAAEQP
ncbi:MAG: DUF192 domain-containing protein [Aphanocapsa feldmannii 288cV]|nr:MAG: DUF192 domain-containing protein [Aphanocapsa feldmannii 288cV]